MTDDLLPPDLLVDTPPITDEDIDAYFAAMDAGPDDGTTDVEDAAAVAAWSIEVPGHANWAAAKLAVAHAVVLEAAERRDAYVQRFVNAYDAETKRAARDITFFTEHLTRYAIGVREQTEGRVKTVTTPSAKIATRETSARVVVDDSLLAVAWAKDHAPEVVKTTEAIILDALRAVVTVMEVPTKVVMAPCACVVNLDGDGGDTEPNTWADEWTVATGMTCLSCGQEALVGRWLDTVELPSAGEGLAVEPARVTVKVTIV